MTAPILQSHIPYDISKPNLPGVSPFEMKDWLWCDDAFASQMALRDQLVRDLPGDVLAHRPEADAASVELLRYVLDWLAQWGAGYHIAAKEVIRPDGVHIAIAPDHPMQTLARLIQADLCVLQKSGTEHVLTAAALCFPANWRLEDKIGRPLGAIHDPVPDYDTALAKRVQRLFDGVQVDRPLWRFNALRYADPDLHQPLRRDSEYTRVRLEKDHEYIRSERQCILRLPQTEACIFSIHTCVVKT